jgi:hypothetical protein
MRFEVTSVAEHESNHVQVTAHALAQEASPFSTFGPPSNSLLILHLNKEAAAAVKVGTIFKVEQE